MSEPSDLQVASKGLKEHIHVNKFFYLETLGPKEFLFFQKCVATLKNGVVHLLETWM